MPNTDLTGTPYPAYSDEPDIPGDIRSAVEALELYAALRFDTATARDAALDDPEEGMLAWLRDSNKWTTYTGSAWTDLVPTDSIDQVQYAGTLRFRWGSTVATTTSGGVVSVDTGLTTILGFVAFNGDENARNGMIVGKYTGGTGGTVNVRCRSHDGTLIATALARIDWLAVGEA